MSSRIDPHVVRVNGSSGEPVGAGCLLPNRKILTCAHVVADALSDRALARLSKLEGIIQVQFPFSIQWQALFNVSIVCWRPLSHEIEKEMPEDGLSDVAILELGGDPPSDCFPAELVEDLDLPGQDFESFGYPHVGFADWRGRPTKGQIGGRIPPTWFCLEPTSVYGQKVREGFSGAPVWACSLGAVAGIIVDFVSDPEMNEFGGTMISVDALRHFDGVIESALRMAQEAIGPIVGAPGYPTRYVERTLLLKQLRDQVLGYANVVAVSGQKGLGLHGMGGIGKTVLAAALVRDREIRRTFSDGIYWTTVGQYVNLGLLQASLYHQLTGRPLAATSVEDGKKALEQALTDKRVLVVLDDVWEPCVADMLPPPTEAWQLLITTRVEEVIEEFNAVEEQIPLMNDTEALALLERYSGKAFPSNAEHVEVLDNILRETGKLALALALVGTMAREAGAQFWPDILQRLREARLDKIAASISDYKTYQNLLRSLEASAMTLSEFERTQYRKLAVFPEDTFLPMSVLEIFWRTDVSDRLEIWEVINKFVARALASWTSDGRLMLHDLQRKYLRATASNLPELHGQLVDAYKMVCSDGWATRPDDGYFFQYLPYHLKAAGRSNDLKFLLLDYDWIDAQLRSTDIITVCAEYEKFGDDPVLCSVQKALRVSSPALLRNRLELSRQLIQHLQNADYQEVKALLKKASYVWRRWADNIEQAISQYRTALTIYTVTVQPLEWAKSHDALATAYFSRIRGDRADNLEQAIGHYEEALKVYTREDLPEAWARTQNNLANAYRERIRGERTRNLERAVELYTNVLTVLSRKAFPVDWAMSQNNLGIACLDRIRGDRADNLEQAIGHYEEALNVYTREAFPADWAMTQNNLANAYRMRIRGDRAENLERSIYHCENALEACNRDAFPLDWAALQNSFGLSCLDRIHGERAENLERAIHHFSEALTVYTREAFPEMWAMTLNNLGNAYRNRRRGEWADNLERAIEHYLTALTVFTSEAFPANWAMTQNNLAVACSSRVRGERTYNLGLAIHHFEEALRFWTRESFPADHIRAQRSLGKSHFERADWASAHSAYTAAIEVGNDLFAEAYTELGRQQAVGDTARLYIDDAYALLRLGRAGDSLLRLEQGKARLLSEALPLVDLDLAVLPKTEQEAMQSAQQAVRELEAEMRLTRDTPARRSDTELADALRKARAQLKRHVDSIRAGHPEFMPTGLDLPELLDLIPEGGALVAPLFTSKGSAVFVLPHGTVAVNEEHIVELEQFGSQDLDALLTGDIDDAELSWFAAYAKYQSAPNNTFFQKRWFEAIERLGRVLWERLMEPISKRLAYLGLARGASVLMIPQGGLGLLPLHAAQREVDGVMRYFIDDYCLSYVPSGFVYQTCHRRLGDTRRRQRSLLAIIDPTDDLPLSVAEGDAVSSLFDPNACTILAKNQATRAAVIRAARDCNYVHFSCHGYYDWQDPMQSGLLLADAKAFKLGDIIADLDLSAARLVSLSSGETGLTEFRQYPDEFLGLPASFLQAGTPAVVSSLWMVFEDSTALLMERFYKSLIRDSEQKQPLAASIALREAQLWLRSVTAGELVMRKDKIGEEFAEMPHEDTPFKHPCYWAAFTFLGA